MDKICSELKKHASGNTRAHCLFGYYSLGKTKAELSKEFSKDKNTITNWIHAYEQRGDFEKLPRKITYIKIDQERRDWIVNLYKSNPVLFQREAVRLYFNRFHQKISVKSISRILKESNMTRQVLERRALHISLIDIARYTKELNTIPWMFHQLVFLDEISIDNTDMWRTKGYGIKGDRIFFRGEFSRKIRNSLLCFCGVDGMINSYIVEGTFTRESYVQCLRKFVLDRKNGVFKYPGPRSVFIMDGAKIHTDENITLYLRSMGIYVLFLPAYSPFLNPIEILFGIMKQYLKATYVENTKEDQKIVLGRVIKKLTRKNLLPIFKKCGYVGNSEFNPGVAVKQDLSWFGFKETRQPED